MIKIVKFINTFIISFIIAYLIVGYVKDNFAVAICWKEGATIWDKLREYYIRDYAHNMIPSLIIAITVTIIISLRNLNKR